MIKVNKLNNGHVLPYVNDGLIYFDESHINQVGAVIYGKLVHEEIAQWLGI